MYEIFKITQDELKKYLVEGKTYEEIAEIYGCSHWTILNRVKSFGLQKYSKGRTIAKLGKRNPMNKKETREKVSNTISKYYKQGIKMGFQNLQKVATKINLKKEKCDFCGSKDNICLHHIDGNQSNHLKTNIEILCRRCHIMKHYQPYMIVGKIFEFEAAHKLPNIQTCERLHGHSYKMEVRCGGRLNRDGMVINFSKIKNIVNKKIIDNLDHYYLNKKMKLEMPTAENMLVWIFKELNEELKGLKEIRLWETKDSIAIITDKFFTDMFGE